MSLQTQNRSYWNKRAASYTDVITKNMNDGWDSVWAEMLISYFPKRRIDKILDIGTGPGFYSIILAQRGYSVTAIDFSSEMLREAKANAGELSRKINFQQMDAQNLTFPDKSFDVIVTRNLTWNLPNPIMAYEEWYRVLTPGGVLLNFDANWYSYLFDQSKAEAFTNDRINVRDAGVEDHEAYPDANQMEAISLHLPMGKCKRPNWDERILKDIGFINVESNTHIGETVWNAEEKLNYASTPGFLIKAVK